METIMNKTITATITDEKAKELRDEIIGLLEEYHYETSQRAVDKIIDAWLKNNGWLINLFEKSPLYNGNFQIVIPANLKRPIDSNGIDKFTEWACKEFCKKIINENEVYVGMFTYYEYEQCIRKCREIVDQLYGMEIVYKGKTRHEWQNEVARMTRRLSEVSVSTEYVDDGNGKRHAISHDSWRMLKTFERVLYRCFNRLKEENTNVFSKERSEEVNVRLEDSGFTVRAVEGQKISKFIGKLLKETGLNKVVDVQTSEWTDNNGVLHSRTKDMGYNYHYALLGDSINPHSYEKEVVISVHPCDYYTMSFGYDWASCHTIDKENDRNASGAHYEGCYSGGTESYMLDDASFIVYVRPTEEQLRNSEVDEPDEMELQSKFQRCVFSLGEDKLLQMRVYPDGRDGGDDGIAAQLREIVQSIIAELLNTSNMWTLKKGTGACRDAVYTVNGACHYEDYFQYGDCNVSYLRRINGELNTNKFGIGSRIICPSCGTTHSTEKWITCPSCTGEVYAVCERCGAGIGEYDDYIYTREESYYCCEECAAREGVYYCEDINEYSRYAYHDDNDDLYYYHDDERVDVDGYTFHSDESANNFGYYWSDIDDEYVYEDDLEVDEYSGYYFNRLHHSTEMVEIDGKIYVDRESAEDDGWEYDEEANEWIAA